MRIFPAVDLKNGKAVRLRKGRADQVTVFNDDAVAAAEHWIAEGADFLHLVDLDGAFDGKSVSRNAKIVKAICRTLTAPVQLGGGIRTIDTAKSWLDAGVTRLIIGTMAIEEPGTFAELCRCFPGRIGVSLDTENGHLKTRGWVGDTNLTIPSILPRLRDDGAAFIIHTDISRDGMQSGLNIDALDCVVSLTPLPVIAAGGVATMNDVKAVYALSLHHRNMEGAITGRAIYEGTLSVREATLWLSSQK